MKLTEFFRENPRAAIAFSGGADSAYLFYAAVQSGAYILRDIPVYGGSIKGELCTPTGTALLKHFAV